MKKLEPLQFIKRLPGETPKQSRTRVRSAFHALLEDDQVEVSTEVIEAIAFCYTSARLENGKIIVDVCLNNANISKFKQSCEMFWNEVQRYYVEKQNARSEEWCYEVTARRECFLEDKRDEQGTKILKKKTRPLKTGRVNSQYYHK